MGKILNGTAPMWLGAIVQIAAAIWWASSISADVSRLKTDADHVAALRERIVRLEARLESIDRGLEEIRSIMRARIPPP